MFCCHVTVLTYVRTSVRLNWNMRVAALTCIGTSLILDIHVNWPLSRQGIRWLSLRDHISGSSRSRVFFKLTADQILGFFLKLDHGALARLLLWGRGRECMQISAQIKPWRVVDFSSDIFPAQSSLGKSLIYRVRNFYNLAYTPWKWCFKCN